MEPIDRRMLLGAAGIAGVAAMSKLVSAGPLNPPPGPVTPTGRTLDEISGRIARTDGGVAEPRIPVQSLAGSAAALHVITAPGSYYLTGNLDGAPGKNGVEIAASGVTIDLRGFTLRGVSGSGHGMTSSGSRENIVVRNGCVEAWGGSGIDGNGWYASVIEQVIARHNSQTGIRVAAACAVRLCLAQANATGVSLGNDGACEETKCLSNTVGIYAQDHSVVRSCAMHGNSVGVEAGRFASVEHCAFRGGAVGLQLSDEGSAIGNTFAYLAIAIKVNGTGCFVAKNVARNAAYVMGNGNTFGPVVAAAGIGALGDTGGQQHPWANFVH